MRLARQHRPAPVDANPVDVVRSMKAFITDLEAGHPLAVAMVSPAGEMPLDAQEWADYATDPIRLEMLAALQETPTA